MLEPEPFNTTELTTEEVLRLWSFLTPREILKLQERVAFLSSVLLIKAKIRSAKGHGKPKSLRSFSLKLGYNEYYLHQAFSRKHIAAGRYYWTALFRALDHLKIKPPEILMSRYEKFKERKEANDALLDEM